MKKHKGMKATFIISILCIMIGAFCVGMGIVQDGSIAYLHVDNETADWWPFRGSFGINLGELTDNTAATYEFSQTFDDVNKLELDVVAITTTIRVGNSNSLHFYNIKKDQVSVSSTSNSLKIQSKNRRFMDKARLDITVRKADILKKLDIDVAAGHLAADGLRIKDLIVEGDATDVEMDDIQVQRKMELSARAGSIVMKNMMSAHSELDVQAGSVELYGDFQGKTKIECEAGSVDLYLQGKEDSYGYKIKNKIGSVELGKHDYSGLSNEISERNSASNQLEIDCEAGSVEVHFDHA